MTNQEPRTAWWKRTTDVPLWVVWLWGASAVLTVLNAVADGEWVKVALFAGLVLGVVYAEVCRD